MASANAAQGADAEHTKNVGRDIARNARKPVELVREKARAGGHADGVNKGIAGVRGQMSVIASCGEQVGVVEHIEGNAIKLTKNESPDGQHHFIPIGWIDRVDNHVHLRKDAKETEQSWKSDAASCQCEWPVPLIPSDFVLTVEAIPDAAPRSANGSARVSSARAGQATRLGRRRRD
jgi:hypothetical protein